MNLKYNFSEQESPKNRILLDPAPSAPKCVWHRSTFPHEGAGFTVAATIYRCHQT